MIPVGQRGRIVEGELAGWEIEVERDEELAAWCVAWWIHQGRVSCFMHFVANGRDEVSELFSRRGWVVDWGVRPAMLPAA